MSPVADLGVSPFVIEHVDGMWEMTDGAGRLAGVFGSRVAALAFARTLAASVEVRLSPE